MPKKSKHDIAEKVRSAKRVWLFRAHAELQEILDSDTATVYDIQDAVDNFDERLEQLDDAQSKLEEETAEGDVEAVVNEAAEYRTKMRKIRIHATGRLAELSNKSKSSSNPDGKMSTVRLPEIDLPKFSGDYSKWTQFWELFESLVDKTDMSAVSKFTYLSSVLEGEPKSVIHGLALTSGNYEKACDMLKSRYGRKERIIFSHIQGLMNVTFQQKSGSSNVSSLWKLQDELLSHVRSLETLGVNGANYGMFMTPLILSRLPTDIRLEWARNGDGRESDLDWLIEFLRKEIERRERSDCFRDISRNTAKVRYQEPDEHVISPVPSASALQTTSQSMSKDKCLFCDKQHRSQNCWNVRKMSKKERYSRIRKGGACFRCLSTQHIAKQCSVTCSKCAGNHHDLICTAESEKKVSTNNTGGSVSATPGMTNVTCSVSQFKVGTVMQTARVKVLGSRGLVETEATVLFDSGSDRSYVTSALVKKVKPKWIRSEQVCYASFGGGKSPEGKISNVHQLDVLGVSDTQHSFTAVEVPKICAPLYRPRVPLDLMDKFHGLCLADEYAVDRSSYRNNPSKSPLAGMLKISSLPRGPDD